MSSPVSPPAPSPHSNPSSSLNDRFDRLALGDASDGKGMGLGIPAFGGLGVPGAGAAGVRKVSPVGGCWRAAEALQGVAERSQRRSCSPAWMRQLDDQATTDFFPSRFTATLPALHSPDLLLAPLLIILRSSSRPIPPLPPPTAPRLNPNRLLLPPPSHLLLLRLHNLLFDLRLPHPPLLYFRLLTRRSAHPSKLDHARVFAEPDGHESVSRTEFRAGSAAGAGRRSWDAESVEWRVWVGGFACWSGGGGEGV